MTVRGPCQDVRCSIDGTQQPSGACPATQHQPRDESAAGKDAQSRNLLPGGTSPHMDTARKSSKCSTCTHSICGRSTNYLTSDLEETIEISPDKDELLSKAAAYRIPGHVSIFTLLRQLPSLRHLTVARIHHARPSLPMLDHWEAHCRPTPLPSTRLNFHDPITHPAVPLTRDIPPPPDSKSPSHTVFDHLFLRTSSSAPLILSCPRDAMKRYARSAKA